jgi:YbgC/YbaW family acyl-CoA thioester hydrolase
MTPSHVSRRRVEFSDTDMAGIAHFSRFFLWMEQAEHDFLESRGLSVVFEDQGFRHGFPRVNASCDYQRPVRYRDWLEIAVSLEKIGRSSLQYRFDFKAEGSSAPVATGRLSTCLCRLTEEGMRSTPLPEWMRQRLEVSPGKAV